MFLFLDFARPFMDNNNLTCLGLSFSQGTVLEGHALVLQLSHSVKRDGGTDSSEVKGVKKGGKSQSSTKIIVRNVAFEATRKDLQKLFSPFGQVCTHP